MSELDSRTVAERGGRERVLGSPLLLLELAGPVPLPSGDRESRCLDYLQTKVCVLFAGFLAWDCRAGDDHQGAGCAHCAQWRRGSREGTPRGHSGWASRLPRTQRAPFVVGLHVHSVSCSEAGGALRPSHPVSAPPALTLSRSPHGPCPPGAQAWKGRGTKAQEQILLGEKSSAAGTGSRCGGRASSGVTFML